MAPPTRNPDDPIATTEPAPSGHDTSPPPGGRWIWPNIGLAVVLFFAVQWYLNNVYRYNPWIPAVTFQRAQTAVALGYGWLARPFLAAFGRGKMGALLRPAEYLDPDTARVAGRRGVSVTLAACIAAVVVATNLFPILYLRYDADGERDGVVPVVLVDGRPRPFQGNTIPVLGLGEEPPSVVVTGSHGLYRVPLSAADMKRGVITRHKRILLNRHFLYEDLGVALVDPEGAVFARFTIAYDGEEGLEDQCAALGEDVGDAFQAGGGCAELLRLTLDGIGADLMASDTGSVTHGGRTYGYDYALEAGANLRIRVPPSISELARYPGRALAILGSAAGRDSLVADLRADLGNLSVAALNRLFAGLFRTNGLAGHLRGTVAEQRLALDYVSHVLALGVLHVNDSATAALVGEIERRSLGPRSPDTVFLPAIGALIALSRDNRDLRLDVLVRINAFLRELHTSYNSAKPEVADILADMLHDEIDADIANAVLDGLATVYGTALGVGPVIDRIAEVVAERRNVLAREDLLLALDLLPERAAEAVRGERAEPNGAGGD